MHGKSENLAQALSAAAAQNGGRLDWCDYINICLYDSHFGYYMLDKLRVGKDGADFYTGVSSDAELFAKLLSEAAGGLAKGGLENLQIAEIGAEPECTIFKNSKSIRVGETPHLEGSWAVFSNELLDAFAFSRYVFKGGAWQRGFLNFKARQPFEDFAPAPPQEASYINRYFPVEELEEGFRLDISFEALKYFENLCRMKWRGVIIFADYFRNVRELLDMPQGTARVYVKHQTSSDLLLAAQGGVDITYSPCSDMFSDILKSCAFESVSCHPQEKFFVERCPRTVAQIISPQGALSSKKRAFCELVSPTAMGASFKILSAAKP